jgi:hypothetical protein
VLIRAFGDQWQSQVSAFGRRLNQSSPSPKGIGERASSGIAPALRWQVNRHGLPDRKFALK